MTPEHLTRRQLLHRLAVEAAAVVNTAELEQQAEFDAVFQGRYRDERRLGAENVRTSRMVLAKNGWAAVE